MGNFYTILQLINLKAYQNKKFKKYHTEEVEFRDNFHDLNIEHMVVSVIVPLNFPLWSLQKCDELCQLMMHCFIRIQPNCILNCSNFATMVSLLELMNTVAGTWLANTSNFQPFEDGELEMIHMNVGWKQSCPRYILTLLYSVII